MTFQAYLDSIKAKTGKTPDDFIALAREKGLLVEGMKATPILAWLKEDFDLGSGHAMAIFGILKEALQPRPSNDERIAAQFAGGKSVWQEPYDELLARIRERRTDRAPHPRRLVEQHGHPPSANHGCRPAGLRTPRLAARRLRSRRLSRWDSRKPCTSSAASNRFAK